MSFAAAAAGVRGGPVRPDPAILERNLAVIARRCPGTADRIRAAMPRPDVEFALADDGGLTGTVLEGGFGGVSGVGGQRKQLASRRAPIVEGERLADTLDLTTHAAFVVLGFGLGHHAAAIAARLKHLGALVVYEPDVALLRAVLERADYTATLGRTNLVLLTDADDTAAMAAAVSGLEGVLASGTRIVEHPGSRQRLAASAERFAATFTGVMRAVRTQIVTTLVQVEATLRNCLQNLETYATAPGIDDLIGSCRGRPAVVVSAGPSLERNVELLARPGVRDRVVIIAVQTALKPLLARGIKPHFVTALDYHEISRRFYEGLTAEDVEGVTLVVEPKANPAILGSFPGVVRCVGDHVLDRVLGDPASASGGAAGIAQPRARLNPGATVAHLAYYLARALGADPVMLIGQDLGFTDGQYYAAGAAIHRVWAPELHEFRTLEMFEWERIMRMKSTLHRVTDQLGRPMFTDEQMATYLVQFERDFTQDQSAGLTTIDATEGGASKRGTVISTLADALAQHAREAITLPRTPPADTSRRRRDAVMQRLRTLNQQVMRIATLGRETAGYLGEMIEHHSEQSRVNRLIGKAQANAQEAASLVDAHWLVQFVNQTGQLNRYKADRAIEIDGSLSDLEKQKRQIERDLTNVTWLADAADRVSAMLVDAMRAIETGKRLTRDPLPPAGPVQTPAAADAAPATAPSAASRASGGGVAGNNAAIAAAILVDPEVGGLGRPRPLGVPFAGAPNLLAATLARVIASDVFDHIALLATDEAEAKRLLAAAASSNAAIAAKQGAIIIRPIDRDRIRTRLSSVGAARLFGRWCWRGGLGGMSVFDEAVDPVAAAALCAEFSLDALAAINADWCCTDPAITREVVDRFRERPDPQSLTFTQAPPGIAPAVLGRGVVEQLATNTGPFINIGALLSYIPVMPQADPIARTACAAVDPEIRDTLERCIADGPESRARLERAVIAANGGANGAAAGTTGAAGAAPIGAREAAAAFLAALRADESPPPAEIITVTADPGNRPHTNAAPLADALTPMLRSAEHAAVTIDARAPGSLAAATALAQELRARGAAVVHIRTALRDETAESAAAALAESPGVLSFDLYANQETTYGAITGRDDFQRIFDLAASLLEQRDPAGAAGLPRTWLVPRITRRDETYEDIEGFYDNWMMRAGACVIDPQTVVSPDAAPAIARRIRPLPVPGHAARRRDRVSIAISGSGSVSEPRSATVHA